MAQYKTYNIEFIDWNDNEETFYEIATDIKEALAKFYGEVHSLTRIVDIYESKSDNYYITEIEGDTFEYHFKYPEEVFYEISRLYAFNDLYDIEVKELVCEGRPIHYVGWQPGMTYEYKDDETNETVWIGDFPEWDH